MSDSSDAGVSMLASLGIDVDAEPEPEDTDEGYEPIVPEVQEAVVTAPPVFSVPRTVLVRMVEQVVQVVPTRDFVPALKNLVLEVSDGRLSITGSDSTSTVISHSTAVRVTSPGRVLISAHKFANVIKRAAGNEVTLRCEDQMLHVSSPMGENRRSEWSLRIAPVQEYVRLAELGDLEWATVDRKAFARAVGATRYAASADENDPARMQLCFAQGDVTATDKTVFAQCRGQLPSDLSCEMSTSAVDLILKMLDRNDATEFRLANTRYHMVAELGPVEAPDRVVVAHQTEEFPAEALNAVNTPLAENRDELVLSSSVLLDALHRAVPTSDEETDAVALHVGTPDAESVTVATRNRYGDLSSEIVGASFVHLGSDKAPSPRTVILNHLKLTRAIQAAGLAKPGAEGSDEDSAVRLLLGVDRSRSRPAFVLVCDGLPEGEPGAGSVRSVLPQVRSDWMN